MSDGRLSRSSRMSERLAAFAAKPKNVCAKGDLRRRDQPAFAGRHIRSGARQSMPSISMASCPGESAMVLSGSVMRGQVNPPWSIRFENRHVYNPGNLWRGC